jgi:hypothetical protein
LLADNNGGPGRPFGCRDKFTKYFIEDLHGAWREGGAKALRQMTENDPSALSAQVSSSCLRTC